MKFPLRTAPAVWAALCAAPVALSAATPAEGDRACAQCHRQQALHYADTPMARALVSVAGCEILKQHPDLTFQEGPYRSRIERQGDRSILTVTNGSETVTVPLEWAFGLGRAGQTYVFERNGFFYESRVSFYEALGALDITMGAQGTQPKGIDDAAGRRMDASGARDCFGCHTTGAVSGTSFHLETMTPGIGCTVCHGPAAKHVAALQAGDAAGAAMPKLGALSADEMANLCGTCHRTWSQIAMNGPRGINNVRFQPYRLTNSRCFDATDPRMRCTACHDPHLPLETTLSSYDAKCSACHSAAAHTKTCPVAKGNCVTCHMPKIDLPGAHARFTDHQIRIARPGNPYPN